MLNKLIKLVILFCCINLANADGGFFVGIGAGYASLNNTPQGNYVFKNGTSGTQNSNNIASTLYFGYDYNRFFGIEGDYNVAFNSGVANSYNVNQQLLGLSLLGHLPFGVFSSSLSSFSLFAKLGMAYNQASFSMVNTSCTNCVNPPGMASTYSPIYGVGAEYGITSNVGIRAEYNYVSNLVASNQNTSQVVLNSNFYLLSIVYHF